MEWLPEYPTPRGRSRLVEPFAGRHARALTRVRPGAMKIRNRLNPSDPCFSFEFFPPKTEEGRLALLRTVEDLRPLDPGFVSVTYGAGGSAQGRTVDLVREIRATGLETMAHLTCVGHTREELGGLVQQFLEMGVENILALRGDPPSGQRQFEPPPGGFRYASELVRFIRERDHTLCVGGAGYPEGHVETPLREDDLRHLKAKVDAGLDFVERARRVGINVPIVPGIMPITNFEQLERFVRLCGATVPMRLVLQLERYRDDPEALVQRGVAHATVQCMELLARGVPGIHFYTLNKSPATRLIVSALRGRDAAPRAAAR